MDRAPDQRIEDHSGPSLYLPSCYIFTKQVKNENFLILTNFYFILHFKNHLKCKLQIKHCKIYYYGKCVLYAGFNYNSLLNCTSTKKVWQYSYYKYTQRYKLFSTFTQSLIPLRRIMGCIHDGSSSFSLCWLHSFLIHIFLTSISVSLQVSVSPFVTYKE